MAEQNPGNSTSEPAADGAATTGAGIGGADNAFGGDGMPGGPGDAAGGMAEGLRAADERMRAAGGQIAGQGSELGLRMLDQAETNTREAFRMMRAAAQAHDMTEVMRLQSEYMREQSTRSVAQVREIGELIASFGRATIGQMTGKS